MGLVENNVCNLAFQFLEFWPTDYFPVYPKLMRRVLPLHFSRVFSADYKPASFNRNELNIAIHIRLGDWLPTAAERFIMQIKLLFKYLDAGIPANVHVFYQFSQDQDSQIQVFTEFFANFTRATLVLHKNTDMTEVIDLMLLADVLMVSESSLGTHLYACPFLIC
jgi:hypothetical protein